MREPTTKGRFRVSRAASDADHPGSGLGSIGAGITATGSVGAEAVAQLVAQNQLVLARLTELEHSWRTYVGASGSRVESRDLARSEKEREAKVRKDEVEQRLLVSDTDKPFRRMFMLVDSLRSELDSTREKRNEHESMMKVLKQKNTSLTGKLEAEQTELARLRKENDRLRAKNDQLQKTARARTLTTDLNAAPVSNIAYAAISATTTARPPMEAVAPSPPLALTTAIAASSGGLAPAALVRDRQSTLANSAARTPPGAVGRVPPGLGGGHGASPALAQPPPPPTSSGPQHYAPPTQQQPTKVPAVPGAPAPARSAQIVANGIPAAVSGTPGTLGTAAPNPLPPSASVTPTQVAPPAFVAPPQMTGQAPLRPGAQVPPAGPPLTQPSLAAPPQTQPPQFPPLQRASQQPPPVQNPYPSAAPLPGQAHPGVPPPPAAPTQQSPMPHADVLGAFRVPDPAQSPNEPFCAVRHAVEEDEFGAIAGRTAQ